MPKSYGMALTLHVLIKGQFDSLQHQHQCMWEGCTLAARNMFPGRTGPEVFGTQCGHH